MSNDEDTTSVSPPSPHSPPPPSSSSLSPGKIADEQLPSKLVPKKEASKSGRTSTGSNDSDKKKKPTVNGERGDTYSSRNLYYYLAVVVAIVAVWSGTILSSTVSTTAGRLLAATSRGTETVGATRSRSSYFSLASKFSSLFASNRDSRHTHSSTSYTPKFLERLFATMTSSTTSATATSSSTIPGRKKEDPAQYKLINKTQLSPDSYWLRYEIPKKSNEGNDDAGDDILGYDPFIPTCIKVDYPDGTCKKTLKHPHVLSKSYSPVSHPMIKGHFDLIVKSYDAETPGGGVGKYICDMPVGQSITASLKSQRVMHGSPNVLGRGWKHIGLVAGGTGIAPLLQIARIVLNDHQGDDDNVDVTVEVDIDDEVHVHLLFINRFEYDILGKSEIDKMAEKYKGRFHVFYALTGHHSTTDESNGSSEADHAIATATAAAATNSNQYHSGRGDVNMAKIALPPPSPNTMIFVCGKDGFVEHWGGPVVRAPPPPGKKKGPKIQGPLLGILAEAGYTADQVFKY